MKKAILKFHVLLFCFASLTMYAQTSGATKLGEVRAKLPPINYSEIDLSAYEPGKFNIKFSAQAEQSLSMEAQVLKRGGVISLGISGIDLLNEKFNVVAASSMLAPIYKGVLKSTSSINTAKHHEAGLHLWYELEFDTDANVSEIINAYSKLSEVEVIEPVFKKVLIEPVETSEFVDLSAKSTPIPLNTWIPNDPNFNGQWHYNNTGQSGGTPGADIKLPAAWSIQKGRTNVIVGIFDGGVDFRHSDLAGNMWPAIGPEGNNTRPDDHGTHVAGTISAVSNNANGVAGIAGGSGSGNGVRIMSLDIFNGSHNMNDIALFAWAADNGVAISQNSWGYTQVNVYNQSTLDAIDYFNAHGGGDVLDGGITIFAAGNNGSTGNWYPAAYSGAFAVAATDHRDEKASYSNYGNWVDVSAPGSNVLSTTMNGGYAYFSGTSMACPHASGVAALVLSHAPGQLTANQLKDIIRQTTDNHYAAGNNASFAGQIGTGRVNALRALQLVGNITNSVASLYEHCSYGGYSAPLRVGDYTLSQLQALGVKNNDISSFRVNGGIEIELFRNDHFEGGSIVFNNDVDCLVANGWNDEASSLKVRKTNTGVPNLSGTYIIENRSSGLVMDVAEGGNPANGTNILQWTNLGGENQQFTLNEVSPGVYSMICVKTNKAVDVAGISQDNFANIHQWEYVGGANQHWRIEGAEGGFYKFIATHSEKIIEVEFASHEAGANINQYDDNNQLCGQWRLIPASQSSNLNGTYFIENRNSGLVMDVSWGDPANGTNILQYNNLGGNNQQFTFTEVSKDVYSIINVGTNKAVDVKDGSFDNNANIHQWEYVGVANQQWRIERTADGFYKFFAMHGSNKIIDIINSGTQANDNIVQYADNNQLSGQWRLIPAANNSGYGPVQTGNADVSHSSDIKFDVNPNPATREQLNFLIGLQEEANVVLSIYDINGRVIKRLDYGHLAVGEHHKVLYNNLQPGLYFARIVAQNTVKTVKIIIR